MFRQSCIEKNHAYVRCKSLPSVIQLKREEITYMDDTFFFEGGYAELYLYKFKKYNSSVGKYIQDMKLKLR